jgi:cysteine desulfurase
MNVYLDNNATTRPSEAVVQTVSQVMSEYFGNPSSIHSFGQKARHELDRYRRDIAGFTGTVPEGVLFTSGGTEANNHLLRSVVTSFPPPVHIVTSVIEHESIRHTCEMLLAEGVEVTFVGVDHEGLLDPDAVVDAIRPHTRLVSIMLSNNDLGALQPVAAIGQQIRQRGILMHSDTVQAVGKVPVNLEALNVDFLSISAHKFHGPRGVGALIYRPVHPLCPLFLGGHQERDLRAGTENLPGIAGMAVALQEATKHMEQRTAHMRELRNWLEDRLTHSIPGTRRNGPAEPRVPNTLNLSFEGVRGQALAIRLDLRGIAVSTGSACSSQTDQPSRLLLAMGRSPDDARGGIRISLGPETTFHGIEYAAAGIEEAVSEIRASSRRAP